MHATQLIIRLEWRRWMTGNGRKRRSAQTRHMAEEGESEEETWEATPMLSTTQEIDAVGWRWEVGRRGIANERMWIQVSELSAQALFIVWLPAVRAVSLSVLCSLVSPAARYPRSLIRTPQHNTRRTRRWALCIIHRSETRSAACVSLASHTQARGTHTAK